MEHFSFFQLIVFLFLLFWFSLTVLINLYPAVDQRPRFHQELFYEDATINFAVRLGTHDQTEVAHFMVHLALYL